MRALPNMLGCLVGAALIVGGLCRAAEGENWTTDWEAAKSQAAKEQKLLLIDFSGSDWCGWCKKLDKEVFSQETFLTEAKKKFVLVLLDFPRDKSGQSEALQKQNDELQERFGVEGFPSVFLATADGTPFAQTGYQEGGPEKYLAHLDEFLAQRAKLAKLQAALPTTEGLERAKLLDEICTNLTMDTPEKAAYMTEIVTLDADNKAGLKGKYLVAAAMASRMSSLRAGKPDDAIAACDKVLAWEGLSADERQTMLIAKSEVVFGKGDKKAAKALLLEAKKVAPESPTAANIDRILAGPWFKDVE